MLSSLRQKTENVHRCFKRSGCAPVVRMPLTSLASLRSVITILVAVDAHPDGTTVKELCESTSLSRDSVDHGIQVLLINELILRGHRRFGRPLSVIITDKGHKAATHVRSLEILFAPELNLHDLGKH